MTRMDFKWPLVLFLYITVNCYTAAFGKTFPNSESQSISSYNLEIIKAVINAEAHNEYNEETSKLTVPESNPNLEEETNIMLTDIKNMTRNTMLSQVRPGQHVVLYDIKLKFDGLKFFGTAVSNVVLDVATSKDFIVFHIEDIEVLSVMVAVGGSTFFVANFLEYDGILEIFPDVEAAQYTVLVEYYGKIGNDNRGIFHRTFRNSSYIGMNLHPTSARRVFPCMDEPEESSVIKFTFTNLPFQNIDANSLPEGGSTYETHFRPLQGPAFLWGMVAHDLILVNYPTSGVRIYGRSGTHIQDTWAAIAVNYFFSALQDWTEKPYFEINSDQNEFLNIIALTDSSADWYALSNICIWEPYIFMKLDHSIKQRVTVLSTIAQSMARQWFGSVIYAENWKHQWVISGLGSYAAYEVLRQFESDPLGVNVSLLDINTLFVTEVIQESLLRDGYTNSYLQPRDNLYKEYVIRDHVNGLLKYKAPAILRMLRFVLGHHQDYIQKAATALLQDRKNHPVNTFNFYDAITAFWWQSNDKLIDDLEEFLEPWIMESGYPVIHVLLRQGGLVITQEHFGFSQTSPVNYAIPLTFTTSVNLNFEDENLHEIIMMDSTMAISIALDEQKRDFVLFNIQGQGYYRVNYDYELWLRIIDAFAVPEIRNQIHHLNRATVIDDSFNLARAGKLNYEIPLKLMKSMEHETHYSVWKAFIRNIEFIRKRLIALAAEDGNVYPNVYSDLMGNLVVNFEQEIGYYPSSTANAMVSLIRGLVMDHVCRADHQSCIDAAFDWFYDRDYVNAVNPNIPPEIRPAVYCTVVRHGDQRVINALYDRLAIEDGAYERIVILESLGCSRNTFTIVLLLLETIEDNNRWGVEERGKIFAAVAGSSYENAKLAMSFMSMYTSEIRNMYGGPAKLEALIYILAENMVSESLVLDFQIWVNSINSNLVDSQLAADKARDMAVADLHSSSGYIYYIYELLMWGGSHSKNVI